MTRVPKRYSFDHFDVDAKHNALNWLKGNFSRNPADNQLSVFSENLFERISDRVCSKICAIILLKTT